MKIKGLDFSIHELTPCMTPIQTSMICEEQKKDASMQGIHPKAASRMAQLLQRGRPSPEQVLGPER